MTRRTSVCGSPCAPWATATSPHGGALPECVADDVHYTGTYVAGCYNRLRDVAPQCLLAGGHLSPLWTSRPSSFRDRGAGHPRQPDHQHVRTHRCDAPNQHPTSLTKDILTKDIGALPETPGARRPPWTHNTPERWNVAIPLEATPCWSPGTRVTAGGPSDNDGQYRNGRIRRPPPCRAPAGRQDGGGMADHLPPQDDRLTAAPLDAKKVGLLVVGRRRHRGAPALHLGLMAHATVHHAACPFAVVPPGNSSCPRPSPAPTSLCPQPPPGWGRTPGGCRLDAG